jgi:hypothetical protein
MFGWKTSSEETTWETQKIQQEVSSFIIQGVPLNLKHTWWHAAAMFCIVTNSIPISSLASAVAHGGFHVKWDTLYVVLC